MALAELAATGSGVWALEVAKVVQGSGGDRADALSVVSPLSTGQALSGPRKLPLGEVLGPLLAG
ncbi:MAG: hypothetical protein K0U98_01600 [Deltaproteobacteria bacterium]|nr:hypothetical protein [Deltaproteobacteria bacterium]